MSVQLTHIGESIVSEIINEMRWAFIDRCGLTEKADRDFVEFASSIAFQEVKICTMNGLEFDGGSRVDVVVLVNENLGVPFELKLGTTGVTKNNLIKWMSKPTQSRHKNPRFNGSMMGILAENHERALFKSDLTAQIANFGHINLCKEWFVISRHKTILGWEEDSPRLISFGCKPISIQDLVEWYGDKDKFNELVHSNKIIPDNPFGEWSLSKK